MASIKVYKQTGAEAGTMNLDDSVFAVEFNEALVHQVVVAERVRALSDLRSGRAAASCSHPSPATSRRRSTSR